MDILVALAILAGVLVIGIPLLVLCWGLLVVVFQEHAMAAVVVIGLLFTTGPHVAVGCVVLYICARVVGRTFDSLTRR